MLRKITVYVSVVLDNLCHRVGKLLSNKTAEIDIPDCVLSDLARCFVEDVRAFLLTTKTKRHTKIGKENDKEKVN